MVHPARVHAILAREADRAVIFRRGPTYQVAVIGWDLKNDTFELGQWFRGRIYPYRCDLSPDGKYLIYFAAKYGRINPVDKRIAELIVQEIGEQPPATLAEMQALCDAFYHWKLNDPSTSPRLAKSGCDLKREQVYQKILRDHAAEFAAMEKSPDYQDASWTAISQAPCLKALDLWINGSGWNGGGIFVDNHRVWINRPQPHRGKHVRTQDSGRFQILDTPPQGWEDEQNNGECPGIYFSRLERDGWIYEDESSIANTTIVFTKPLPGEMMLEKRFNLSTDNQHEVYWEQHILYQNKQVIADGADWHWAEYDAPRNRIVYTQNGTVCALDINQMQTVTLQDFNDMKFKRPNALW